MNQEVEIIINGRATRQIAHNGKLFIVAKPGTQYEIRLKNNSTSQVMGVASIDGLSVLDGEPAKPEGPGYVIHGYGSYNIKGWRTSDDEVHPFEFSKKDKSYAAKGDQKSSQECGVIGVIFHSEKMKVAPYIKYTNPYPWDRYWPPPCRYPYYHYYTEPYWLSYYGAPGNSYTHYGSSQSGTGNIGVTFTSSGSGNGSSASVNLASTDTYRSAEFDLGTKFSHDTLEDQVTSTSFESGGVIQRTEIFYASKDQLEKMGVPTTRAKEVAFPKAFSGYCKVPKGKE